jgi:TRAP transporter TAXI family solute receptor
VKKSYGSHLVVGILVLALLAVAGTGCSKDKSGSSSGDGTKLALATASLGGTYYIVGAGIADILTKNVPGLKVDAIVAQGSVGNPKLADSGEAQLAITNYTSAISALKGDAPYNKKLKIAGIMHVQFSILHLMTTDRKDINSIADLKGKKIAMGPAGGGGALLFMRLLPFWGLDSKDISPSYVSYSDGSDALKDGNVAMNIPHGAYPLESVTSMTVQSKIKLIPIEEDKLAQITAKYPDYERTVIPAKTYPGVDKATPAIGIRDILVVKADMDEKIVYQITKSIYEHLEQLKELHPSLKNMTLDGYKASLVPLHPGAKKFYDEKGIKVM